MEKINLSLYRKSGEGANGSSYDCITDPTVMVKMYNSTYPLQPIIDELEVARKVYGIGIPSPEPGVLVTDGERTGIKFRRIEGKRSYSRMIADEPHRVEEYTREFARYCKELHATHCPEGVFPDAKGQFLQLLEALSCFNEAEKAVVADFIRSVPDCDTALHGDMHIGNVISTLPAGAPLTDPHEVYFIDLGYFSHGYPLFDLGMLKNICLISNESFRQHDFHIDGKLAAKVWEHFFDEYFYGPERLADRYFGPGATRRQVDEGIDRFICMKLLLVAFNIGEMPPHYELFFRKTFNLL